MKFTNVRFMDFSRKGIIKFGILLGVKIELSDGRIFYAEDCTSKDISELCWKNDEIDNLDNIMKHYFCYDKEYVKEITEGELYEKFLTFDGTFEEWNEWL